MWFLLRWCYCYWKCRVEKMSFLEGVPRPGFGHVTYQAEARVYLKRLRRAIIAYSLQLVYWSNCPMFGVPYHICKDLLGQGRMFCKIFWTVQCRVWQVGPYACLRAVLQVSKHLQITHLRISCNHSLQSLGSYKYMQNNRIFQLHQLALAMKITRCMLKHKYLFML